MPAGSSLWKEISTGHQKESRNKKSGPKGRYFEPPPEGTSDVFFFMWKSAGVLEPGDFRFYSADLRFKSLMSLGQECLHLNLQSEIINQTWTGPEDQVFDVN
jgi:hypothetical protein